MSSYSLVTSYAGQSLIDGFDFVTISDPTFGFVSYQSYSDAQAAGLVSLDSTTNAVTLSVDTINTFNPDGSQGGRPSVRIESKESVDQGLVIGDFAHMPGSVCGAWPAFWMYGPNWPAGGEVDIIEGANMAYDNLMSAHTSSNCALPSTGGFMGTQEHQDCSLDVGCNYIPPATDTSSYGDVFNGVGGGVYALQWTSDAIQIWHFSRGDIPQDIIDKVPDPSNWGAPQALFGTSSCDVDSHFANMSIVVNTDFCGSYAGTLWSSDATCSTYASTCADFVGNNPSAFTDLYWQINYIEVYSASLDPVPSQTSPTDTSATIPDISIAATDASITGDTDTSASIADTSNTATDTSITGSISNTDASASIADTSNTATDASITGSISDTVSQGLSVVPAPSVAQSGAVASGAVASGATGTAVSASAPSPIDSIVPMHNPATIDGFVYLGCFSSNTAFSTFNQAGTDPAMTLEKCTSACSANRYAGVMDSACYCANTLDAGTGALPSRESCNKVCTGNSAEFCGGSTSTTRRAASAGVLLTVYLNLRVNATIPSPAPALAAPGTAVAASVTTITSTVTYVTVCSTNPAQLVTLTSCITFTACATATTPANVPVTTTTQSCAGCGANGSSVVTLTIPLAAVITQTSNITLVAATIKPTSTPSFVPVAAAAPPVQSVMVSYILMAVLTFVGMFLA